MKVEKIGKFGAYVSNIDLNQYLDEESVSNLKRLLLNHKILVFKNQNLSSSALLKASEIFGIVCDAPRSAYTPVLEAEKIQHIERHKDFLFGGAWHNDNAFSLPRAAFTALYSVEVPSEGGDTQFVDQELVLKELPQIIIDVLENKTASTFLSTATIRESMFSRGKIGHGATMFYDREYSEEEYLKLKNGNTKFAVADRELQKGIPRCHQKCILKMPEIERKVLNISPAWTKLIDDLDETESSKLLKLIFDAQTKNDEFQINLKWESKMFVVWDNRQTLHRATQTSDGDRRIMYRVIVRDPIEESLDLYKKQ